MKVANFAKITLFLVGMIGFAAGGLVSISSMRQNQQENQIRVYEALKSESQILVDQFFSAYESAKNLSQNNTQGTNPSVAALPYVSHVGVIKLQQALPHEFESLASQESIQMGVGKDGKALDALPDLALEERVLKAVQQSYSTSEMQVSKVLVGTFSISDRGNREGIFVATPIYKNSNGTLDPTLIERLNIVLLDPVQVMASLTKPRTASINPNSKQEPKAAYLINRYGKVLAHTQDSFVGTELKKTESLRETVENLFIGAQTGAVSQYSPVEGQKRQVAFVRAGVLPFAIGTEQAAVPQVLSAGWWNEQVQSGAARQHFGSLLVLTAVLLALGAGASLWIKKIGLDVARQNQGFRNNRRASQEPTSSDSIDPSANEAFASKNSANFQRWKVGGRVSPPAPQPPPEFKPSTPAISVEQPATAKIEQPSAAAAQIDQFVETRLQSQGEQKEQAQQARQILVTRDYEKEFIQRIRNHYTLETIERELSQVSAELTESPVLYFRYHRQTQNLNLAAIAGKVQIPNYALMQAYVRKDIEQQVERLAMEGKVASVANYGPLNKLVMNHLNTAHFEAWVINSDPDTSGSARMVGVLIILQAGFRSAQTRPILASILKEAGNLLYAQTSKLRPRRYEDVTAQNSNPTL